MTTSDKVQKTTFHKNVFEMLKLSDSLGITIELDVRKPKFPPFPCDASECQQLTDIEEQEVNQWKFDKDLKFSAPVNLRDSKTAYLLLVSDEPERDDTNREFLQWWGLGDLQAIQEISSPDSDKGDVEKAT